MTRARDTAGIIQYSNLTIDSNNAVGIGSSQPDTQLDVNGGVRVTGIITATSFEGDGSQLTGIDATSLKDINGTVRVQANEAGAVVTGILTATNLEVTSDTTISGNLTVQGTTVTLDTTVQEVDLLNIQANSTTPAIGVTQSGSGAIAAFYDGAVGVATFKDGGGLDVAGAIVASSFSGSTIEVGSGITISGTTGITLNESTNASHIINPLLVNYAEKVNTLGNTGANATIDVSDGTYVTATLDQSCTFTFTSPPTGKLYGFALQLTNGGTGPHTITWPGTVKWPGGSVPARTTTDAKTDIWSFFTSDGGSNWYGSISQYNFS